MNLERASLVGLLLAVLALVALLLQHALFSDGAVGITIQLLALLLMLWARLVFGRRSFHAAANPTEGGLVTSGPYRFLRHPIYAAVIYFMGAGVASHPSTVAITLAATATVGLLIRMLAEERLVAERYPEYRAYAARTKRIIPFVL